MVRAIRLGIELVDPLLEDAAGNLGASPSQVFLTVTLPLAWPAILTGMILAFARSIGEFGATITFAGNIAGSTRTLPLAMYTYTQIPGGDAQAVRLMVISMLISFAALLASEWLSQRALRRLRGT
jgi:molybdate transport system permease protein